MPENAHAHPNTFLGVSLRAQDSGGGRSLDHIVLIKIGAIRVDNRVALTVGIIKSIIVSWPRADDIFLLAKIVGDNALRRVAKTRILGKCAMDVCPDDQASSTAGITTV